MTSLHHLLNLLDPPRDGAPPTRLRTATVTDLGPPVLVDLGGSIVPTVVLDSATPEVADVVVVLTTEGATVVLGTTATEATPRTGWVPIDSGTESGSAAFTTPTFETGVYDLLVFTMRGNLAANGILSLRINGDGSSIYSDAYTRFNVDGTVAASNAAVGSFWTVGYWGTVADANTLVVELFDTAASSPVPIQAHSRRQGGERHEAWGALSSDLLVSSLRIGANSNISCDWWLSGYRS